MEEIQKAYGEGQAMRYINKTIPMAIYIKVFCYESGKCGWKRLHGFNNKSGQPENRHYGFKKETGLYQKVKLPHEI